jgi:HlyD family secretion protein
MPKKKKKLWLKIGLPVVILLVVAGLVAANLQKSKANVTEVNVEKTKTGRLVETVSGTGRMQPEVQVKISANVSARILELTVKEGNWVKKGDLLVRLDRTRYEALSDQAVSGQKSAEAGLAKARSDLTRVKELTGRGMASQADLEAAEAQFQFQSAQLEQAQAGLKQAQDDLSKTSIYSPMDGIVSLVNKEVGEIALGAQFQEDVILVVADLTKMEVLIEIDENDIVNVVLKDTAKVKIDAYPDTSFKGEVREIAHTATTRGLGTPEELTNFQVKIAMLEVPEKLRPGMSATADVFTEVRDSTLHIPIQAVVLREPGNKPKPGKGKKKEAKEAVQTASADTVKDADKSKEKPIEVVFKISGGIAHKIPVKTGISSDSDIEILSGLALGDSVVIGPFRTLSQKLEEGDKIKVKPGGGDFRKKEDTGSGEQSGGM